MLPSPGFFVSLFTDLSQKYAAKEIEKDIESNAPSVPAPLLISPAAAKNQLESRLAEQLAMADTGRIDIEASTINPAPAEGNEPVALHPTTSITGAKKEKRSVSFDHPEVSRSRSAVGSGGFPESFRGFDEDSGVSSSSSSSGSDDSGDANNDESILLTARLDGEGRSSGPKRRTTSEALERRPLDDGDEDDDAREEGRGSSVAKSGPSGSTPGENNQVAASAGERPAPPMRHWNWPAKGDGGARDRQEYDDDDDDDDEDGAAAIEMGTKYMRRRASNQ